MAHGVQKSAIFGHRVPSRSVDSVGHFGFISGIELWVVGFWHLSVHFWKNGTPSVIAGIVGSVVDLFGSGRSIFRKGG